jgi:hypothetical protein
MTMNTYTTDGSVRGDCGHRHRTLSGAIQCLARDQAGCKSQGGYSDRQIRHSDGSPLTEREYDQLCQIEDAR